MNKLPIITTSLLVVSPDKLALVSVALTLALYMPSAQASLNGRLDEVFNGMSNHTNPNTFQTERRGVIAGGSFNMRVPVKSANVVNITLPNAGAGCSGIDLYGGSFSYINSEEFVAFMRSVAANASGYAFQIALSSMCEKCSQHMEMLQKKVQELNQYFGNSCQLAQGIVNDSLSAFGRKGLNDASLVGQFSGLGDLFNLNSTQDASSIYQKVAQAEPEEVKKLSGNIVWQALVNHTSLAHDHDLAQAIMSITGTIIADTKDNEVVVLPHSLLSLRTFIEGGDTSLYRCNTTSDGGCLAVTVTTTQIDGLAQRLVAIFNDNGIVHKLATNSGSLSATELAFVNSLPSGVMAKIRTLSAKNAGVAKLFVLQSAPLLSFAIATSMIDSYVAEVEAAIGQSNHAYATQMLSQLTNVRNDLNAEKITLAQNYGNLNELEALYDHLLHDTQLQNYVNEAYH